MPKSIKKVGFIPLRAGSKGIRLKNRRNLAGKPLFDWVLRAANKSNLDKIYVYTDDDWIISYVKQHYDPNRVIAMTRPECTATDEASTESAMIAFCESVGWGTFEEIYLLQATSPLTRSSDINICIESLELLANVDSVLTVVPQKRFLWDLVQKGDFLAKPVNYDPEKRSLRQEIDSEGTQYVENGAIYGTSVKLLYESGCRISGDIALIEMPKETYFEVDDKDDLEIVESLLSKR